MSDDKQKQIDELYAKYQRTLQLLNDALDQLAEKPKEVEVENAAINVNSLAYLTNPKVKSHMA